MSVSGEDVLRNFVADAELVDAEDRYARLCQALQRIAVFALDSEPTKSGGLDENVIHRIG